MNVRPKSPDTRSPSSRAGGIEGFVRDFAGGVRGEDLHRLFERDALRAFAVLSQDEAAGRPLPSGPLGWLRRAQLVFLGFAYRLSPARRLLFAGSLGAALVGTFDVTVELDLPLEVVVDSSPFWFLAAIGGLLLLLALELVDRVRVRDELEVARQLQRELLPAGQVALPGLAIEHDYRTANEVGGDVYDFIPLPGGKVALVIGDASGHGIAAGLLMATARAVLGLAVDLDPDPLRVVELLNRRLCKTGDRRAFMSLFYGVLDPATGRLDYLSAGHPFPLLRRSGGEVEELGRGGLPLGLRETLALVPGTTAIGPGDLVVLYTDGLPEAVDERTGEAFGFVRLRQEVAASLSPRQAIDRLLAALEGHLAGEAPQDDVSLAAVALAPVAGIAPP